MLSPNFLVALPFAAGLVLYYINRRFRGRSLEHLPGPPHRSWLVGNIPSLARPDEVGDFDFSWTREYGNTLRIQGVLGEEILFTADPKALQYILNTSGYNFPKPLDTRLGASLSVGKGIVWAEGLQHSRHRKIMNPAFSYGSLKGFLPLFRYTAQKSVTKLRNQVRESEGKFTVVDISPWLSRATLDAIGLAGFDYDFGAIDEGSENKLAKAYNNLFVDAFLERSDVSLVLFRLFGILPEWLFALVQQMPTKSFKRLKEYMKTAREVAKTVVDRHTASYSEGKEGSKDVMTVLVRANLSENPKSRLNEEEVLSQLTTLFLAGHETTATTVSWALYELAKRPEYQAKLREEIKATRRHAAQRGEGEITIADLDSMKYLLAVMKETLRFHPIVSALMREAGRDDDIPLATPQKTRSGELVSSIPVRKGQHVIVSLAAYNRVKTVWGEDADEWRPERFLEEIESVQKVGLGVIANVATFSSGLRSCIGWKFAMIEMQAILIELLDNFEFAPAPNIEIIRGAAGVMTPMVKGSASRRTELPIGMKLI